MVCVIVIAFRKDLRDMSQRSNAQPRTKRIKNLDPVVETKINPESFQDKKQQTKGQ
jgi:hypothetical protein